MVIFAFFIGIGLLSCQKKASIFKEIQAAESGINFVNSVTDSKTFNILTYPYLYNGAGVAIADFNRDGLQDLFFVANKKGSNKLYFNKGNFKFTDVTQKAGVAGKSDWCTGVAIVDINNDGWLDVYVSTVNIIGQLKSTNELYINNKNNTFTESASKYNLNFSGHTTQAAFFDYDNDSDLDCFLLNHAAKYSDDYKDISTRKIIDPQSGDKLLRNDNGFFTDVTQQAGILSSSLGYGLGIAIGDLNKDGWQDIYVSNDFKENDYCYINNKNGTYTEQVNKLFGHVSRFSMGNDMADFNNDGWLDIFTLDMLAQDEKVLKASVSDDDLQVYNYKHNFGFHYQFSKNCLQQNVNGKTFVDVAFQKQIAATDWSWAPLFADFNNDGLKDLYISNGFKYRVNDLDFNSFLQAKLIKSTANTVVADQYSLIKKMPQGQVPDYFYLGTDDFSFADVSADAGFNKPSLSNGAAYGDLDNDGNLDLVVNRLNEPAGIYRNNTANNNYVSVELIGPPKNTLGIGCSLSIFTKGKKQLFIQQPVRGFMSSVSPVMHIGLGEFKKADSLIINWPDGKTQSVKNISAKSHLKINYNKAQKTGIKRKETQFIIENYQNVASDFSIDFEHVEDDFNDLNVNPLLPHSLATQGPKIAVADINADQSDDFYICGAKGQAGVLFVSQKNKKFKKSIQQSFLNDALHEDVDALFFDADGDKDQDLYVASGGNEFYGRNNLLKDRLYINNGKGIFTKSTNLPDLFENKSCVKAGDIDHDGDLDLFIGGRANARMYGYIPSSALLINNGKGNFTEKTALFSKDLNNIGMVTDACFSDIDNDGWQDLIVVGEWMPVTVFKNKKGKLIKQNPAELAASSGWWNCIYKTDLDNDGDDDFLLGNWGNNSKLTASAKYPLMLYLADWDNNGDTDPILATAKNGLYYPFLGKSELEKRLPFIKKKFLRYQSFAGKTINEVFGQQAVNEAKKLQVNTTKSFYLINNNGSFDFRELPGYLQVAPIFSFTSFKQGTNKRIMATGNFYEVSPYEGKYDALLPTVFSYKDSKMMFNYYINENHCVRDVKVIKLNPKQNALLMAKNNEFVSMLNIPVN